jgi:hypothetical protein
MSETNFHVLLRAGVHSPSCMPICMHLIQKLHIASIHVRLADGFAFGDPLEEAIPEEAIRNHLRFGRCANESWMHMRLARKKHESNCYRHVYQHIRYYRNVH